MWNSEYVKISSTVADRDAGAQLSWHGRLNELLPEHTELIEEIKSEGEYFSREGGDDKNSHKVDTKILAEIESLVAKQRSLHN